MNLATRFAGRWPSLGVESRRIAVQSGAHVSWGPLERAARARGPAAQRAVEGLWRREPSVWSADPAVQASIRHRLGWLSSPELMADSLPRLTAFADSVRHDGFTDVVLLGMGGSSLAPEVLRAVLGVTTDRPRFVMLDSTDPAAVAAVTAPPRSTLYLLASKSGTTIEPNALAAHFRAGLERSGVSRWGDHFVAITDPGTVLEARARDEGFREVFLNPSDIGGRYSALSLFGLVPAALMGHQVGRIVAWALAMLAACEPGASEGRDHPAGVLGLAMGAAAEAGRDKLTLLLPARLEPFGLWVEQLVAESTGKQGKGVVPISGEAAWASSHSRGSGFDDRLFVRIRLAGQDLNAAAPRPLLVDLTMPEPEALGAEFVRWEIATAVAAALLRINPFDEPNVQQAKEATRLLLGQRDAQGRLPPARADVSQPDGVTLALTSAAREALGAGRAHAVLTTLGAGDYLALLAYLGPDAALADALDRCREEVRDRRGVATLVGYGPRYLHSTGQLHKGGPNTGVFVIVTATPTVDLPIPGEPFSFGTLELAQARGDFASLEAAGRRGVHIHLPAPDPTLLGRVLGSLVEALRTQSV